MRYRKYAGGLPYMVRLANRLYAVRDGHSQVVKTGPTLKDGKAWVILNGEWVRR